MNATPPSLPRRSDSDEIVLTDRHLVSCYMRYSENPDEIPYSPEKSIPDPASSSPASTISIQDEDFSNSSGISNSTTQTTPLRSDLLGITDRNLDWSPFAEFELVLQSAELPSKTRTAFREQGRNIMRVAAYMFPQDRRVSRLPNKKQLTDVIEVTRNWLAVALHVVEVQVQNIDYIQTLGPFTVALGSDHRWPVYKQMAELIVKHTKQPSRDTVSVINRLATVYDAYVYQPALVSPQLFERDRDVEIQLHGLYDAIMSLLTKHQQWCRSMKLLNENHIRPVLNTIMREPAALKGLAEEEAARQAVDRVLNDPTNPGYTPVSADVLKVLREKRSAQLLRARAKRQFARVNTV